MKRHNYFIQRGILLLLLFILSCQPKSPHNLIELNKVIPDIVLDIRYATENNFVGEVLYPSARCFLAKDPAKALKNVQADLKQQGFRLKVYDGYRPLSVQKRMWEIL
ncbi:MAG: D-alanyl-D-alanine carboxypeptidase family protein, partial [Candidatus Marinimicrobia bacterium]|nr:D-alanyl-D-alanine carboxypeptidase family protein [Candidatus Neomarinimicrobiota bacterium]